MATLSWILLVLTVTSAFALPKPAQNDMSMYFDHTYHDARLVGGTLATEGSVPYMVALSFGFIIRSFFCGASVVSSRHILTAAHCIDAVVLNGNLLDSVRGTVGTLQWNTGGTSYAFSNHLIHANYDPSMIKNDIGMLYTSTEIQLNNLVQIVPLNYDYTPGGVITKVAGWGRTFAGSAASQNLLSLHTITLSHEVCDRDLRYFADLWNYNAPPVEEAIEICTFHSHGRGNCNGDSGSALVNAITGEQVGIVSWGFPCAIGAPDFFVRISGFQDWIEDAMA